jgi:hypothetical protein
LAEDFPSNRYEYGWSRPDPVFAPIEISRLFAEFILSEAEGLRVTLERIVILNEVKDLVKTIG